MSANFTQIQRYFFTKIKKDDTPVDEQKYYILDEGNYTDLLSWNGFLIAVKGKHVYFFNYFNGFSSYEGGLYNPTVIDPWSITAPSIIPSSVFLRVYCRWDLSTISSNDLCYGKIEGNRLFVSDGALYNKIYMLDLNEVMLERVINFVTSTFTLPFLTNSEFEVVNDRIWFTDQADMDQTNPERQKLYDLNYLTLTVNSREIPCRKQFYPIRIHYGKDYYLWITNYNNASIMKFNILTGNYVSTVRVGKSATSLFSNENRDLYVGFFTGRTTKVDQTTDTETSMLPVLTATAENYKQQIFYDDNGNYAWMNDESYCSRTHKTTRTSYQVQITFAELDGTGNIKMLHGTKPFTYQYWNGTTFETRNVRSYIFLVVDKIIYGFRTALFDGGLYREKQISVRGGAMIATGSEKYYGDDT